jgi:hypothetical protein
MELIDHQPINYEGVRGSVETRSIRGYVFLEIAIDSDQPGEVMVDFDASSLSPRGFNLEDETTGEFVFGSDQFRGMHDSSNRYQLTFRARNDTSSEIRMRFSSQGNTHEAMVNTRPSEQ